jgi:hypothetical protein
VTQPLLTIIADEDEHFPGGEYTGGVLGTESTQEPLANMRDLLACAK